MLPVPRHFLFAIAGLLWTAVGLLLCARAIDWILPLSLNAEISTEAAGVLLGGVAYPAAFARVVQKGITRIRGLSDPVSVFAFTAWKGYLMIGGMISLGIFLRSSDIPKYYLSVPYTAMGLSLIAGSVQYYKQYLVGRNEATKG